MHPNAQSGLHLQRKLPRTLVKKEKMPTHYELRQKYPRWAHRRDERKRRRRKSRRRRKRRKKSDKLPSGGAGTSTEGMLVSLLHQLMLGGPVAKKHGENVITGHSGVVKPDLLAPGRSKADYEATSADRERRGDAGGGAGAGAVAAIGPAFFPPEE